MDEMDAETCLKMAVEVGDRLLAEERPEGSPIPWRYREGEANDEDPEFIRQVGGSIYLGVSGIAHFLLALFRETGDERYLRSVKRSCHWLEQRFEAGEPAAPGLYIGQGGPILALLELFEATGDPHYLAAASTQAAWAADQPTEWMDLMNGPPGYGLLFLDLYHKTKDPMWLSALGRCLDDVERAAEPFGEGGAVWPLRLNADHPWITPGLAHGIAGVAIFLHRLGRAGDTILDELANRARTLGDRVDAALLQCAQHREGGLDWVHALEPPGDQFLTQWCHGAPGVAIALLSSPNPEARAASLAAGEAVAAAGDNRAQASQCHGVCGNAETFIELYRATGDDHWMQYARRFAAMAQHHRLTGQGPGAYRTHDTDTLTFDLMTGISGVGYFYLRAARPEKFQYPVIGRWLP